MLSQPRCWLESCISTEVSASGPVLLPQINIATSLLACEQALRGALAVGWEKEGELATTSLGIEFCLQLPYSFPSTELSDLRQSARIGNEPECKQTLKNTRKHVPMLTTLLLVSSPPISISHFASDIHFPETSRYQKKGMFDKYISDVAWSFGILAV